MNCNELDTQNKENCERFTETIVLQLEVQLLIGEGWDPIIQFNPATFFVIVPSQDIDFQRHML